MLFDRTDRFYSPQTSPKHDDQPVPFTAYSSISDFLRQQFLQSRNMFSNTGSSTAFSRPQSAAKSRAADTASPINPSSPDEIDTKRYEANLAINDFNPAQESEAYRTTEDSPTHAIKTKLKHSFQKKRHKPRVVPINDDIPGPGTYYQQATLVKPTFNRVYTEPSYLQHTLASTIQSKHQRDRASTIKGAFLSKKKFPSTKHIDDEPITFRMRKGEQGAETDHLHPYHHNYNAEEAKEYPYGTRYPPQSDQIIQRWTSIAHGSYVDHHKHWHVFDGNQGTKPRKRRNKKKSSQNIGSM
jgi:hypothetical protein